MPTIDLRSLQNAVAVKIELTDGEHDVLKANAEQIQLIASADGIKGEEALARAVALVSELLVPAIPIVDVWKMPPELLQLIIKLSAQGAEAVQAQFPNAPSPEPDSSMSPGSPPATT